MAAPQLENTLALAALGLLGAGCILVLLPFLSALLWAVIICFSTWGLYQRVYTLSGERASLAAGLMTLLLAAVLLVPMVVVGSRLGENADTLAGVLRRMVDDGVPRAPHWLRQLPLAGDWAAAQWSRLESNGAAVVAWLQRQAAPGARWLLARGLAFGEALLQLSLSVLAAFYFYRDGAALAARVSAGLERIAGARALALLELAGRTVRSVVHGILGTALAQGAAATLGFFIAGVPGPFLLGLLVCMLSVVPVGPPLVWVPAALWLLNQGEIGWGVFMLLYGGLVVGFIDNLVKPLLISQDSTLPFLLVLLGVVGGVLAFGFVGVFLGPVLLAVAHALLGEWTRSRMQPSAGPD